MSAAIWKTSDGHFLLRGREAEIPMGVSVRQPDGETITASSEYHLITADGRVARTFGPPASYSLDITLGIVNIHAVIGDALHCLHWKERDGGEPTVEDEVRLSGLRAVGREECPFDPAAVMAALSGGRA
ncbi:MAG TPA: hypothetical protein PK280_08740 [Planctomycetota bacterium]|nr:hypothetical protein [Planctomycetota bacterium]